MSSSRNWINFFLGLIVAALPFLGFPPSWKSAALVILGLLIAFFSLAPRASQLGMKQGELFDEKEH